MKKSMRILSAIMFTDMVGYTALMQKDEKKAKAGMLDEANECLEQLKERENRDKDVSLHMDFIMIYEALGDFDKVFYYFEKYYREETLWFF